MDKVSELMEILKHLQTAGEKGAGIGKSLYGVGKKFAMENPKTSAALGGSAGTLALQKILGKRPEADADEQEQRMRMLQQYGG